MSGFYNPPFSDSVICYNAFHKWGGTYLHLVYMYIVEDVIKIQVSNQMKGYRVRSGRVPSAGTSISMRSWGVLLFQHTDAFTNLKALHPILYRIFFKVLS